MSATIPTGSRGRSDARRNRERLVAAARELFAAAGVEVSARQVARHAGVGVGTLYRHFATKEDLLDAVLADAFEELVEIAEAAQAEPDPWLGFRQFVEQTLALHARNRGLGEVVETQAHGRTRAAAMRRRIRPLVGRLVASAQAQGTLRRDFSPQDLPLLFWGADRVIELSAGVSPELWRRQLSFVLDGLRASAATPPPEAALTQTQLQRIGREKRARR